MARFLQRSFIIAVFCVGLPDFAAAQSGASSGQIVGQVVDPSGAAVPAAHVDVRNKETSYARDVSTDTAGRYAVSQVPLGAYQVPGLAAQMIEAGLGPKIRHDVSFTGPRSARQAWPGRSP